MSFWSDIRVAFRNRKLNKLERKISKTTRKRNGLQKKGIALTNERELLLNQTITHAPSCVR